MTHRNYMLPLLLALFVLAPGILSGCAESNQYTAEQHAESSYNLTKQDQYDEAISAASRAIELD
jgi:hypothetical protein